MKPTFLTTLLALLPGLACAANPAPVASSIHCFEQQVRIESVCEQVGDHAVFKTCRRQTLRIGKKAIELIGADDSMVAGNWTCSADQKKLLVMLSNGGSCPDCEEHLEFDKEGRKGRGAGRGRPDWRKIDVIAPVH
jgi:hypothetical protein